jgi:hypothetical protein
MHDWEVLHDDGGICSIKWCRLCGCVKKEFYGIPHVYFPWAYMKVSETTCALARKMREEENHAPGGSKLRRTGADMAAGEARVGSRVVPLPGAADSGDGGPPR